MMMQVEPNDAHELALEVNPSTQPLEDEACKELPVKEKTPCCTKLKAFLTALCFSYFCKGFSGATMKSTFTQLERRFALSSSTAGFVDGGFEWGNLLVIVFVSYYGAKFHRPRIIAIGSCVMSLGSFLIAMPHFFMGYYKYETIVHSTDNITFDVSPCSRNHTVAGLEGIPGSEREGRSDSAERKRGCEKETSSNAWIYVLLGNMLRGIGETPITPLGISYLDDFSKKEDSPFYIGILHTVAMFGPMAGFLLGSLFARLYVDVGFVDMDAINITLTDSRWVGAWWLGFVVAGVINLISAIPFFFMPKSLNEEDEPSLRQKFLEAAKQNGDGHQVPRSQEAVKLRSGLKDFFKSLKRLLTNGMYVVMLCVTLLQFNSFVGYMTYNPKYMEQQYGQSASKSNVVTGVVLIPFACAGMVIGSFLIKRFKMDIKGMAMLTCVTFAASYVVHLFYFMADCEVLQVAGLTVNYSGIHRPSFSEEKLWSPCNSDCNCKNNNWDPVCGDNGITYMSACLAGCKTSLGIGKDMVFHNCSCVGASGPSNSSAVLGQCPRAECSNMFPYFTAVLTLQVLFVCLGATPFYMIMFRTVSPDLKSFAVGIETLCGRIFGGLPAPIYFGALIDRTCLKWSMKPCGKAGACRVYDIKAFSKVFFGLTASLRGGAVLFCVVLLILIVKQARHGKTTGKVSQSTESLSPRAPATDPGMSSSMGASINEETFL
ncbi:solute carrier organic anion transporter family member 1B3-like [Sphaerodactylus townsendi]|uniref:solute carrier organic anion transporter family member 1B3-like n=1 Tax=Sphaerodactylus townsendi TaxID=933632 RepID=UPI002025C861|nr:solute carrier organic anion transporter family member 1B3-like [Sphaerodactylus townsendi]